MPMHRSGLGGAWPAALVAVGAAPHVAERGPRLLAASIVTGVQHKTFDARRARGERLQRDHENAIPAKRAATPEPRMDHGSTRRLRFGAGGGEPAERSRECVRDLLDG